MKELTYHEIRIKALKNNVRDNKLQIGMWAQFNGYMKRRVHRNGRYYTVYIPLQRLTN